MIKVTLMPVADQLPEMSVHYHDSFLFLVYSGAGKCPSLGFVVLHL